MKVLRLSCAATASLLLVACGGGSGENNTAVAGVTLTSTATTITATSAVISKGDRTGWVYTTTLTARTAAGGAATLDQSKFAAQVFVDVPATTTFGLSPTEAAGQYKLVVSSTVGGTGLPVATAGTTSNLKETIYYNESDKRISFEVPIVLSCSQPAFVGTAPCQSSSASTGSTGSTGSSGGTTGGGTTGGGTAGGGTSSTRSFVSWNGSANGEIVKDANNEDFAFYADTRCLYSYIRQSETSNFCLSSNSASGNFAGRAMSVNSARSTTGTCITVLVDTATGNLLDIVTNSAGVQTVTVSSTRPAAC
jgi:hypothetical protein